MITAKIHRSADGQIFAHVFRGTYLEAVVAGPVDSVLECLPDLNVSIKNVEGMWKSERPLFGLKREEPRLIL